MTWAQKTLEIFSWIITKNIIMHKTCSVDHFTYDGNLPLFGDDVIVASNPKVVIDRVPQCHGNNRSNSFTMTIEIIPRRFFTFAIFDQLLVVHIQLECKLTQYLVVKLRSNNTDLELTVFWGLFVTCRIKKYQEKYSITSLRKFYNVSC